MKTQIPRFLLGGPQGWKQFDTSAKCVILPAFSSHDTAAAYCMTDATRVWDLQDLRSERVCDRLHGAFPETLTLLAVNPTHAGELAMTAVTLDTTRRVLSSGENTIDAGYKLMRDHWESLWKLAKIPQVTEPGTWFVACLYPHNMRFLNGQPLWFWLDWFAGKHSLTELYTERGGNTERAFFTFCSRGDAEGFYSATVARLKGCIRHCQIDSQSNWEFEVKIWEKDQEVSNCTSATINKRF
jgi:hypothetical protein